MAILSFHPPPLRSLAVPSVCLLICFLAYSSQYLFYRLDPGPLSKNEAIWFNLLVAATWWSYERACRVGPGRLPPSIAKDTSELQSVQNEETEDEHSHGTQQPLTPGRSRWCKKCEALKPPRAHHCKQCRRCIPKMDHHCPWTGNCVSHTTFSHFLRFVYYACASLAVLAYHLSTRVYAVYEARDLPSYLGPSMWALAQLLLLSLATALLLFALSILLVTATQSLLTNTTMIESWEIERHEALVEKAKYLGGYVHGPGGRRVRIQKQEFPYDVGVWKNLVQGMGTDNPLAWILPFGGGPENESGWGPWEENGFEDAGTLWPPVDPDKLPRSPPRIRNDRLQQEGGGGSENAFIHGDGDGDYNHIQAFKKRQQEDYKRWETTTTTRVGSGGAADARAGSKLRSTNDHDHDHHDEYEPEEDEVENAEWDQEEEQGIDGESGWTNSDGDRLRDYGVDEEAEEVEEAGADDGDDNDDDVPLGELLRRRRRRGDD